MGFKDWLTSTAEERQADFERREAARKEKYGTVFRQGPKPLSFEGASIDGGWLAYQGHRYPLAGMQADFEHGAQVRGVTASRVLLTGVFALAIKKDKSKVYVLVDSTAGQVIVEGPVKKELEAREFAAAINRAAANHA